ncbi:hypothetical protein BKA70DRAFT_1215257 [Coprinopsis sp. MPI-PUGE-AT-0042]|nr:hypothetical protein BKA70DRAFT_1215257 [Coprinopsis sp. MPI-PUGE-AT-0042]
MFQFRLGGLSSTGFGGLSWLLLGAVGLLISVGDVEAHLAGAGQIKPIPWLEVAAVDLAVRGEISADGSFVCSKPNAAGKSDVIAAADQLRSLGQRAGERWYITVAVIHFPLNFTNKALK